VAVKKVVYKSHDFEINYEIINPQISENNIVFLHGWGSNKEVMKSGFASKLKNFKHIYIDMPGFGKSPNEVVLTTYDYSEIMKLFFASLEIDYHQITIVGHSFGGKVATYLSPKNLILLSTAGIVEEKSTKVKTKIKLAKLANALGVSFFSKLFRSKDVNTMSEVMYGTF
jgi:pimeloyl-ACP methyl ester carboxylesterase